MVQDILNVKSSMTEFPHTEHTQHVTNTYVVRTMCVNRAGEQVTRYMGTVRGMSDNGTPGWCDYPDHFPSEHVARLYTRRPASCFNCYDSDHQGAPIEILRVTKLEVTETTWNLVDTV
jgi:hypothetical protein